MDALRGLLRRLRTWLRPGEADRELEAELSLHVELETERLSHEGVAPDAARRQALVRLGGAERYIEAARDARGSGWLDNLRQDVRHALRLVGRNPQFTLAVVLTLGLGVGANVAIFSVVDAVLLRAWPFADADRLVVVWETDRASGTEHEPASWPDIADMRERARSLEGVGAVSALEGTRVDGGEPERVSMLGVTPDVPDLLGVTPLLGRTFRAGEGGTAGVARVLLSENYWRTRFAARADVIGRALQINGLTMEIVGVVPHNADLGIAQMHARADYSSPLSGPVDVWVAQEPTADAYPRQTHPFLAIGRLRDGVAVGEAQRELATIMSDLEAAYPENRARGVNVEAYEDVTLGPVRRALVIMLAGVGLVLLIACVNVSSLLLARTTARAREVAVRRALGASAGRVRRQFMAESAVLTLLGTAAGIVIANVALRALVALAPADIPRLADATVDMRVLMVALLVAAVVTTLFGLAPLIELRAPQLQSTLRSEPGRGATATRDHRRVRGALVIAQVALAVLLVIAAGLLVRSFRALTAVDPGFRTAGVLQAEYQLGPAARYPTDFTRWPDLREINDFHRTLLERVRALPGVTAAALTARGPLDPGFTNSFAILGREAESADFPEIRTRFISPGYLETLDIPLIAGRDLRTTDIVGTEPVGVINQAAAARYFAGTDPLDQRLLFWGVQWRIVGVIGDERFNGLDADAEPAIYVPLAQAPFPSVVLLARSPGDPSNLVPAIRSVLRDLDSGIPLANAQLLEQELGDSVARPRFLAALLGTFALLATALALIGMHGVLSYNVAQRTPELGIRLALGATRTQVIGLVLRDGMSLAAAGTIIGLVAGAIATRTMAALLFGISAHDAVTFAAVTVGIAMLALVASLIPARRAARAQPMSALRAE